jgi:hypothetical protein
LSVKKLRQSLAFVLFALAVAQPSLPLAFTQATAPGSSDAAAVKQFDAAIARYMAMRQGLHSEVAGPVKNSSSTQLNDASDALAAAIQRARRGATVGSIFNPSVAAVIKRRMADTVRTENLAPVLANIDDDKVSGPTPKVHLRLPASAQMATMPPALLAVLPVLPKALEYRIIGRDLVLRDVDASLIIDYLPNVIPR